MSKANVLKLPDRSVQPSSVDTWVKDKEKPDVRRLTLDIPTALHTQFKSLCAAHETSMLEAATEMIERWILENKD